MAKRNAKADTVAFMVQTNGLPKFRRAGIVFGPRAQRVERAVIEAATAAAGCDMVAELLNTPQLIVDEVAAPKAEKAPKA
jgi:hypothetical protein